MTLPQTQMQVPQITFITVKTNQAKLSRFCALVEEHFNRRQRILIAVPNEQVAKYIDELLWKCDEEAFIPHSISMKPSSENIVITASGKNVNQAQVLINLTTEVLPIFGEFACVFELLDETHPEKRELALKRKMDYETRGCQVLISC